jgi:hypothetical protein
MAITAQSVLELMPVLYRLRDLEQPGQPLRRFLEIIAEQAGLLEADIEQLYEDSFIETCRPWVVPYIGDLVGTNLVYDSRTVAAIDTASARFGDLAGAPNLRPSLVQFRARADVARTIYYRRRKGTLVMLEGLARDVTGWPVHVVEFMQRLGWTQDLEHPRPSVTWTDIRSLDRMRRIGSPYDGTAHVVDVRHVAQYDGWFGVHNLGFFVWRLRSYPLKRVAPRQAGSNWTYSFSPLGGPTPLFTPWSRQGGQGALVTELEVPSAIRATMFYEEVASGASALYGDIESGASFGIYCGDQLVPFSQVHCRNLESWPAARPTGNIVAIDVVRGRLAVGDQFMCGDKPVQVSFHYGFPADLGGGTYDRSHWLVVGTGSVPPKRYQVRAAGPSSGTRYLDLVAALTAWQSDGPPEAVVTIEDSQRYSLPGAIELVDRAALAIEAADGERPLLQMGTGTDAFEVKVAKPAAGDLERGSSLTLSGVVVEGFIHVTGDLRRLRLLHSTLIPGRALGDDGFPAKPVASDPASLVVDAGPQDHPLNLQLEVEIAFSITGPVRIPQHAALLLLLDSIVDGVGVPAVAEQLGPGDPTFGPPAWVERSTILGSTWLRQLDLGSESIFAGRVTVARAQQGCARFSYIGGADSSRTPRRYRCQPDLAIDAMALLYPSWTHQQIVTAVTTRLLPAFASHRYGRPDYAQLRLECPAEIARGAEDSAEMGAYNHLKQAQRESNLRLRLEEYLPFGLDAGIIYVT